MKAHHTARLIVAAIIIGMGWNTINVGIRAVKAFDRAVADRVEEIAELTRMSGSADGWAIGVVPPEYFFWSPLGRSDNDPQRLPNPAQDAVIFTEGAWTVFYFESGQWRGVQNDCCHFFY